MSAAPKKPFWSRAGTLGWAAVGVFVAGALGAGVTFGRAALDGEGRRRSSLAAILRPEYQGDNRTAPDFSLRDRHGRVHRLSALRGRTVILHFWSRDCPPCITELNESLPDFDETLRGRDDIALVMVTVDPDWNSIAAIVPAGLRSTTLLFDPRREVVERRYGTRLFPETWVIDPPG